MFKTKQTLIGFCLFATILCCAAQIISAQINIGGFKVSKPKLPKTNQADGKTANRKDAAAEDSGKQEDVQINPNAPPDYNANLNVGDQAIAVDHFRDVAAVKILAKSGTAYKTAKLKDPDEIRWYSFNSVYPYFDYTAFNEDIFTYERESFIAPYLPCYAKKHNLELVKVTDLAYSQPSYSNAEEAREALQDKQPKLAELDALLKSKLSNAPNIFLPYKENPGIVAEIASQRGEYLKCAVGTEEDKPDFRLSVFMDDINKAKSEVDRYTPADFLYLVSGGGNSEALLRAVSLKARAEWSKQWLKNDASRTEFNKAWDDLAGAAAKKIPLYKPSAADFRFRYPAGEKLLMDSFKNAATLKIFRIGTDTAGWDIQKDSGNFPSYRYKDVRVYFRDSSADHPYCSVVTARVKQDYSGGGVYNPKIYRSSVSEEIYGCP